MAIFVDPPQWPWHGRLWCHLISDTSIEELHGFARRAGLRYLSFGFDHYDVPDELFEHVQELGAEVIDPRDVVRKLRGAGLRTVKGKQAKRWRHAPGGMADVPLADPTLLAQAMASAVGADAADADVLERSSEVARLAGADCSFLVVSPGPWGWAVEAIWPTSNQQLS